MKTTPSVDGMPMKEFDLEEEIRKAASKKEESAVEKVERLKLSPMREIAISHSSWVVLEAIRELDERLKKLEAAGEQPF